MMIVSASASCVLFFLMVLPPTISTRPDILLPYTTPFRAADGYRVLVLEHHHQALVDFLFQEALDAGQLLRRGDGRRWGRWGGDRPFDDRRPRLRQFAQLAEDAVRRAVERPTQRHERTRNDQKGDRGDHPDRHVGAEGTVGRLQPAPAGRQVPLDPAQPVWS